MHVLCTYSMTYSLIYLLTHFFRRKEERSSVVSDQSRGDGWSDTSPPSSLSSIYTNVDNDLSHQFCRTQTSPGGVGSGPVTSTTGLSVTLLPTPRVSAGTPDFDHVGRGVVRLLPTPRRTVARPRVDSESPPTR